MLNELREFRHSLQKYFTNKFCYRDCLKNKEPIIISNKTIVLASTSNARKKILSDSFLPFRAISPDFNEEEAKLEMANLPIKEIALNLAIGKAKSVSKNFKDCLVIGSDQICELDGNIINKSNNLNEALLQLTNLQGKTHFQHNAVVIANNQEIIFSNYHKASLSMHSLNEAEILQYLAFDQPWGCAGSYKYESLGKHLFSKVDGNYHAIVGLDIQPIISFLHNNKFINFLQ